MAAVMCWDGFCPRVAAGMARGSTVHGPAGGEVPPSRQVRVLAAGLRGSGGEHGDLGFPGNGPLGRGGMREFRARFLCSLRVPLASGDVEDVQGGAGGGVRRGGERVQ